MPDVSAYDPGAYPPALLDANTIADPAHDWGYTSRGSGQAQIPTPRGKVVGGSYGTYGSPAILLRSGVGPVDELAALGIGVVAGLPVGQRLQDQLGYYNAYALAPGYLEMSPAVGSLLWTASGEADPTTLTFTSPRPT
jgi:hypothetical protein